MKLTRLLAVLVACLVANPAWAATCYVKEFARAGIDGQGGTQVANEPALVDQTPITVTTTAGNSAVFNSETALIRVICDAQVSYRIGAGVTAVNTNSWLSAGGPEYFGVQKGAGHRISFVVNP
jgi:hypothetical protein